MNPEIFTEYLEELKLRCSRDHFKHIEYLLKNYARDFGFSFEEEDLRRWKLKEMQKGLRPLTLYAKVNRLHLFIEWLVAKDYLLVNPCSKSFLLKRPAYPDHLYLSEQEVLEKIEDEQVWEKYPLRRKALMMLMYSCALRRAEVLSLNIDDLGEELRVIGKGNKERMVPLGERARKALTRYLKEERIKLAREDHRALFLSENGSRLRGQALYYLLKRITGLGPHALRHACASHMLENGCNVVVIQKLLGHSKIGTTGIYTHVNQKDLKELQKKYHPLENRLLPAPAAGHYKEQT